MNIALFHDVVSSKGIKPQFVSSSNHQKVTTFWGLHQIIRFNSVISGEFFCCPSVLRSLGEKIWGILLKLRRYIAMKLSNSTQPAKKAPRWNLEYALCTLFGISWHPLLPKLPSPKARGYIVKTCQDYSLKENYNKYLVWKFAKEKLPFHLLWQ